MFKVTSNKKVIMSDMPDVKNIKFCDMLPVPLNPLERLPQSQDFPRFFKRCGITVNIPTTVSSAATIIPDRLNLNQIKVQSYK